MEGKVEYELHRNCHGERRAYLHQKLEEVRLLPACPGHAGSLLRGEGHSLQKLLHFKELADCLAKDMRLKPK